MFEEEDIDLLVLFDDEFVEQMYDDFYDGLQDEIQEGVNIFLECGWVFYDILIKVLVEGMCIVGIDFCDGILFVFEVFLFVNVMKVGMGILCLLLVEIGVLKVGKMVIGIVKGDIYDIGKNFVLMMMEGVGFEVIDIGINNLVENYLVVIEEYQLDIFGMLVFLIMIMFYMKVVIDEMKVKGI